MRKATALLLISICLFLVSNAQSNFIEYGFQSGINLNSGHGSGLQKDVKSTRNGFSIGATVKLNVWKHVGIRTGLLYDQNGWIYQSLMFGNPSGPGLSPGNVVFKLNYLNLPVMIEYRLGKKIIYHADAGVFAGLLVSNQLIVRIAQSNGTYISKGKLNYHHDNFGLALGAGIEIPLASKIKFTVDARDNTGLTNINAVNSGPVKTNAFSILAGLLISLK